MRLKLVYIAFLLIPEILLSQRMIPGYMGKKNTFELSVLMHPSFPELNEIIGLKAPYEDLSLNYHTSLEFNHIFRNRTAFCLNLHYSYLGMVYRDDDKSYAYPGKYVYKGTKKSPAVLHLKGLSFGFKFFAKGKFAPVGGFTKVEAILIQNTLIWDKNVYLRTVTEQPFGGTITKEKKLDFKTNEVNSIGGGIAITFGSQKIVFDKLILSTGVRFSLAIVPDGYSNDPYGNKFDGTSRTFFNQFVNLKIGIGFLAF